MILTVIIGATIVTYLYLPRNHERTIIVTPENSMYVTEYSTGSATSAPNAIAVDSSGDVWFTLENQTALAQLVPSNSTIHVFPLPVSNRKGSVTWGITVDNKKGLVWFTEQITNAIWSFNMRTHVFVEYSLHTPNAFPFDITLDQNGDVWFTELFSNKIGELNTAGQLSEFPIPVNGDSEPSGIAVGPTGNVWFTLPGIESIGEYSSGHFAFYNLTKFISCPDITCPTAITVDRQGNLWTTFHGPKLISEYNPETNYFRTISTSVPSLETSLPYFIESTQTGDVWFNEHYGNAMALFEPNNNTLIEYYDPTRLKFAGNLSGMLTMGIASDGTPWFTEFFSGKIGTVNTSAPLSVNLDFYNYSTFSEKPLLISNNSQVSLELSVSDQGAVPYVLEGTSGNLTGNFSYSFEPNIGNSDLNSTVTIHNNGSSPGTYFLTITVKTSGLAVSKIIEVKAS